MLWKNSQHFWEIVKEIVVRHVIENFALYQATLIETHKRFFQCSSAYESFIQESNVWGGWGEIHAFSKTFHTLVIVYNNLTKAPFVIFETYDKHNSIGHIEFCMNHFRLLKEVSEGGCAYGDGFVTEMLKRRVFCLTSIESLREKLLRNCFPDVDVCDGWLEFVNITRLEYERGKTLTNRRLRNRQDMIRRKRQRIAETIELSSSDGEDVVPEMPQYENHKERTGVSNTKHAFYENIRSSERAMSSDSPWRVVCDSLIFCKLVTTFYINDVFLCQQTNYHGVSWNISHKYHFKFNFIVIGSFVDPLSCANSTRILLG